MGKVITVWGSPGSGKSMFCCILAKALTRDKRKAIIINGESGTPMRSHATARMWRAMTGPPSWKASATMSSPCLQTNGNVSTRRPPDEPQ